MSAATGTGVGVGCGDALAIGEVKTTPDGEDVSGRAVPAQAASAKQLSVLTQADATNEATSASASAVPIAPFNAAHPRLTRAWDRY
jgi:hypothetical protein